MIERTRPVGTSERVPKQRGSRAWAYVLLTFSAAPVLIALTSKRPFESPPAPFFGHATVELTNRAILLLLLAEIAVAGTAIFMVLPFFRIRVRSPGLAALALVGCAALTAVAKGSPLGLSLVAVVVAFVAAAILPVPPLARIAETARTVLICYGVASLLAGVVARGWAVEENYDLGVIKGFTSRLHGVVSHANDLGPMMVMLLVLEWMRPRRRPWVLGIGAAVLFWSQSKTSWASLVLIAGAPLLRNLRRDGHRSVMPVVGVVALMAFSVYLAMGVVLAPPAEKANSVESFTGRKAVWQVTYEVSREDPLLGYGPDLWNEEMARRFRSRVGFLPRTAHNQLMQTIGVSGLLGAAALGAYVVALVRTARRGERASRGGSTALVALLVLRGTTAISLPLFPLVAQFVLHLITFWYLLAAAEDPPDGASRPS